MKQILAILALATFALAGCDKAPPEVVVVTQEADPPPLPTECVSDDPKWQTYPDDVIDKKSVARHEKENEANFSEVSGKRRTCRAAILKDQKG